MSDQWGTREQPSIPEPACLGAEHAWLGIAVAAFVAAIVALYVDYTTAVEVQMGTYPVLSGLFAGGAVGWRIGAVERRLRIEYGSIDRAQLRNTLTDLHDKVDILAKRVEELAEQRYQDGHADGFVDGAAAVDQPVRLVQGVPTRRLRP